MAKVNDLFSDLSSDYDIEINTGLRLQPSSFDNNSENAPVFTLLAYTPSSWQTYVYICKHCRAPYHSMDQLRIHSMEHHGTCMAWQCVDCECHVTNFEEFIHHVRQHKDELNHYCPYCYLPLDRPGDMHYHTETSCVWCGELNPNLTSHFHQPQPFSVNELEAMCVKTQGDGAEDVISWAIYPWTCSYCNVQLTDQLTLRNHLKEVHEECFGVKCADCSEEQNSFEQFVSHVREHRPLLVNTCEYCDKNFTNENQYLIHVVSKHNVDYKCEKCGECFKLNSDLTAHISKFINKPTNTVSDIKKQRRRLASKKRPVGNRKSRITTHKKITKKGKGISLKSGNKCKYCDIEFDLRNVLNEHIRVVHLEMKFECADCSDQFRIKGELRQHMISKHTKKNFFPCGYCRLSFKKEFSWKKHELLHTGLISFHCAVCKKNFNNSLHYKEHMKNKHQIDMEARPYYCNSCKMDYGFADNYKKHMNTVHGIIMVDNLPYKTSNRKRPYFCNICNMDFAFEDNYKTHVDLVHGGDQNNNIAVSTSNNSNVTNVTYTIKPIPIASTVETTDLTFQMNPLDSNNLSMDLTNLIINPNDSIPEINTLLTSEEPETYILIYPTDTIAQLETLDPITLCPTDTAIAQIETFDPISIYPTHTTIAQIETLDPISVCPTDTTYARIDSLDPISIYATDTTISQIDSFNPISIYPTDATVSQIDTFDPISIYPTDASVSQIGTFDPISIYPTDTTNSQTDALDPISIYPMDTVIPQIYTFDPNINMALDTDTIITDPNNALYDINTAVSGFLVPNIETIDPGSLFQDYLYSAANISPNMVSNDDIMDTNIMDTNIMDTNIMDTNISYYNPIDNPMISGVISVEDISRDIFASNYNITETMNSNNPIDNPMVTDINIAEPVFDFNLNDSKVNNLSPELLIMDPDVNTAISLYDTGLDMNSSVYNLGDMMP